MTEPTTEAGRRLRSLIVTLGASKTDSEYAGLTDAVIATETEAAVSAATEADGYLALLWKANPSLGEALQRGIELNDRQLVDHALRSLLAVGRLFGWDEAGSPKPDRTPEQAATEARAAAVLIAEGYITQEVYDWFIRNRPSGTPASPDQAGSKMVQGDRPM